MDKVIQDIEESENLTFEEKLEALCELDEIINNPDIPKRDNAPTLTGAFPWVVTPSGPFYWADIYKKVYSEEYKARKNRLMGVLHGIGGPSTPSEVPVGEPDAFKREVKTPFGLAEVIVQGGTPEQREKAMRTIDKLFS